MNYKKYSLEKLEGWVHDAMNSDASPQEIYDCIYKVVKENYDYHQKQAEHAYDLMLQLSNNDGHVKFEEPRFKLECDKDDPSPECQNAWNSFWEETSHLEEVQERSEHYYDYSRNDPTRLKYEDGWVYESPDGGKTVTKRKVGSTEKFVVKEDKVKKWILPVEECKDADTDETEYFVSFPDDLLEAADLKEGDLVDWVNQGDGSYLLKKHTERFRF